MLGYYNLANLISFCSLAFGILAIDFTYHEKLHYVAVLLLLTGIFDMLDGKVSRSLSLSREEAEFGAQLDSLVDVVVFGVCPIVIFYLIGLRETIDILLFLLFIICAVVRLAYFNISGVVEEGSSSYYIGLPTTFVAFIVAITFTLFQFVPEWGGVWPFRVELFVMSLLFILKFKLKKPKGIAVAVIFALSVIVMILNLM